MPSSAIMRDVLPTSYRTNFFSWLVVSLRFHYVKLRCYKLYHIHSPIFIGRRFVKIPSKKCSPQIAHCSAESMRILVIKVESVVYSLEVLLIYREEELWLVGGKVGMRNGS